MQPFLPPHIEAAILAAHDLANEEAEGWRCVGLTPKDGTWITGLIGDTTFLSKMSAHQRLEAAAGLADVGEWFRAELEPLLPASLAEAGGLRFLMCRKSKSRRMDAPPAAFPNLFGLLAKAGALAADAAETPPRATEPSIRPSESPDVWSAPADREAAWLCLFEPPRADRSCSMHEEHTPSAAEARLLAAFLRRIDRTPEGGAGDGARGGGDRNGNRDGSEGKDENENEDKDGDGNGTKIDGSAFGSWVHIRKAAGESDADARDRAFLCAALLSAARRARLGNPKDLADGGQGRLLAEIAAEVF